MLVSGVQNILRAAVTIHTVLERIYFDETPDPLLWRYSSQSGNIEYNDNSAVFRWAELLGRDIIGRYPLEERKEGFIYTKEDYTPK